MSEPKIPSGRPRCPNHFEYLEGLPFPLPRKGQGRCPISGCMFDYEVQAAEASEEMVLDKFGNLTKKPGEWKITGEERVN